MLSRQAAGTAKARQAIAANMDTLFLCMSLNADFNIRRMERYLALAWESGATPVIVLTKADLCDDLPGRLRAIATVSVGVEVLVCSAQGEEGYRELRARIKPGETIALVGSSGVGKSTLINRLMGQELLATRSIREEDGRGRHTTTHRQLVLLPDGGILIDTPGMRELRLDAADLSKTFEDIEQMAAGCKYGNCAHGSEPGCIVRRAIQEGTLSPKRLESYQKLKREMGYEGLNARQLETEKINRMFGGKGMGRIRKEMKRKTNEEWRSLPAMPEGTSTNLTNPIPYRFFPKKGAHEPPGQLVGEGAGHLADGGVLHPAQDAVVGPSPFRPLVPQSVGLLAAFLGDALLLGLLRFLLGLQGGGIGFLLGLGGGLLLLLAHHGDILARGGVQLEVHLLLHILACGGVQHQHVLLHHRGGGRRNGSRRRGGGGHAWRRGHAHGGEGLLDILARGGVHHHEGGGRGHRGRRRGHGGGGKPGKGSRRGHRSRHGLAAGYHTRQEFVGAFPVHHVLVQPVAGAGFYHGLAQIGVNGPHEALGRQNEGPGHHAGRALLIQKGNQSFAGLQLGDGLLGIKGGVGPEGLGGHLHGLLVQGVKARSACCTRLPSWPSTVMGTSVGFWVMKHAHALAADQADHLPILSISCLPQLLNSRWASSKKNTIRGLAMSPTSGKVSYSSLSIHSRKVEYIRGLRNSLSQARILI